MINFLLSHLPWVWFGLFIVFIVIEALTVTLISIWPAIAAFLMIFIVYFIHMDLEYQIILFLVLTIFLMVVTRPFAVKKLKLGKKDTNVNTLIGQDVIVLSTVSKFKKGEAKTTNGVIWLATSTNSEEDIQPDTICTIKEVEGNTIIISPKGE
ncbi:MAG: NfeD family protein [Deferribacterales bacterium]|nr:NfeD family protein [Deferribacterales bacterium]